MCQEFNKTHFITVPVGISPDVGVPIGQGACGAVRLRINALVRNAGLTQPVAGNGSIISAYYGDSNSQENELLAAITNVGGDVVLMYNDWSPKIYCQNLEEVFIRQAGNILTTVNVQIMILSNE